MSVLTDLQNALPEFSRNERKIAEYLLQYPHDINRFTGEAIAIACNTSRSAVIRLCQKLGYQGFSDFKRALSKEQKENKTPLIFQSDPGDGILPTYINGFRQLSSLVGSPELTEIADTISYANRIVTVGYGHSLFPAKQLSFRLNRFFIDSFAIDDISVLANYEYILKQGDVVIIFSISGRSLYEEFVAEYRKNRVKVILITMMSNNPLSEMVDLVVNLPFLSHLSGDYLMDDSVTFFLFIELIIEALHKKIKKLEEVTLSE